MDSNDLFTMAKTIWAESRGEPFEGKVAVAWVIRNRFEAGQWFSGDTLAATCLKPAQFSCWLPSDPNRAKLEVLTLDDPWYLECVYVAAGVLCGKLDDPTGGSCHYYAPDTVRRKPAWADGKEPSARIAGHLFFTGIT